MNEKLEALNQEIEKTEKKLRRAQHEEKILEHQIKTLTRKERTHRLCTRAAMLESYLPHPEAIPEPECRRFIADTKQRFIQKRDNSIRRRLAEAKAQARTEKPPSKRKEPDRERS